MCVIVYQDLNVLYIIFMRFTCFLGVGVVGRENGHTFNFFLFSLGFCEM